MRFYQLQKIMPDASQNLGLKTRNPNLNLMNSSNVTTLEDSTMLFDHFDRQAAWREEATACQNENLRVDVMSS